MTAHPTTGDSVGGYVLGRRLGGGAMGLVFEGLDPVLQRSVAIKVISPELAEDPEFRARFTREAQAQASLDSAHVVHVYAHGEDSGRLWIATQLIPDGDLRSMLDQRGAPPLLVALDLISQVADGLADAHEAGLVHRDIKPANVLLRRRGTNLVAYLADFGIARRIGGEHTRTSRATVGTPTYMAPELHTGGQANVASDIYSLGCLLWATLTGRAPYAGTSDFEVVTAHREQPVPQLDPGSLLAGPINDVLRRTMAKDPAARPESAAAVRDRLRALALPPSAPPPAPAAPGGDLVAERGQGDPARRSRTWIPAGAAAIALVVGVAVGAVLLVTRSSADRTDGASGAGRSAATSRSASDAPTSSAPTSSAPTSAAAAETTPTEATLPSSVPTTSASDQGYLVQDGDRQEAETSMAAAFQTGLGLTDEQVYCFVDTLLEGQTTGDPADLQHLVDIGMFDAQMTFHDIDLAEHPEVKTALSSAFLLCAES